MPDNFLIMKNYVFIYCLLVAVLTSCESEKAGRNELHIVATDSIELDLGEPRALYGNGNMLFVIDRKAIDNFVQVYDLKTKDFLFSFAPMGQGPGEFSSLNSLSIYKADDAVRLSLYDFGNKIAAYDFSEIMSAKENVMPINVKHVSDTGLRMYGLNKTNNGYIASGRFKDGKFALLNDSLELIKFTGEYRKKPKPSYPEEVHFMANFGRQYFSEDRHYMADCVTAASLLTLYEVKDNNLIKQWEYVIEDLDYDVEAGAVPVYKSNRGYASVSIGYKYVYAIYSGEPAMTPDFCGSEVHVFNISTGELVKKFMLDRRSSHIVVDESKGKMYIETDFPEPVVLIYDLPI